MSHSQQLYLVFDANILISDFWMKKPDFLYLRTHQFLGHKPVIPEVVYLEVRNKLKERALVLLNNCRTTDERSIGNQRRLLNIFNYKKVSKNIKWNVDSLLKRWDKHVDSVLTEFGGKYFQDLK